ncbi:MAG: glycosyltransferase [Candidatus Bathyarchaeia archaeon]
MSTAFEDKPKVVVLLTTYRDPPLLANILKSIKETVYPNFELLIVDCCSNRLQKTIDSAELTVPVKFVSLDEDYGAAYQLNIGMWLAMNKATKYIARLEGDAIPQNPTWLKELVSVMENDETIAVAMPFDIDRFGKVGWGGKLYGNGTFCVKPYGLPCFSKVVPCLGTGGHCFITRKTYIEELFKAGVKPYWDLFYISSEDLDFNLKPWLKSYKVVTVASIKVLHEGSSMPKDQSYRAPYRVYHMYKNRVCFLLFNFGYKHILVNIWYRLLHDFLSAVAHSEVLLMLKGYCWVLGHFKTILLHRNLRMTYWKNVSDKKLKDSVLVKLPMPIKKE